MSKKNFKHGLMAVVFVLFSIASVWAADTAEYDTVAKNFLQYSNSTKEIASAKFIESNGIPIAYLVNLKGGGYILISVSKKYTPVKAYSLTNNFDNLPEAFKKSLLAELEKNAKAAEQAVDKGGENAAKWDYLLNIDKAKAVRSGFTIAPILLDAGGELIEWNQGYPYNKLLPLDPATGKPLLLGSSNVAIAQIMKFWGDQGLFSPPHGKAKWNEQTVVFEGKTYNWTDMLATLLPQPGGVSPTEYQKDAIATLMRDLTITNHTELGTSGSAGWVNINPLIENFGFSTAISYLDDTDPQAFLDTLTGEIDGTNPSGVARPVLIYFLGNPGHAAVADGYKTDSTGISIHLNVGWGGSYNDFYYLDSSIPAIIYYGIQPCGSITVDPITGRTDCAYNDPSLSTSCLAACTKDAAAITPVSCQAQWLTSCNQGCGYLEEKDLKVEQPKTTYTNWRIAGVFDSTNDLYGSNDIDRYENIFLKGKTTFAVSCTDTNLNFVISLYNADGTPAGAFPVSSGKTATASNLTTGKYTVKVSLCGDDGGACATQTDAIAGTQYSILVTTGKLTTTERAPFKTCQDNPPVFNTAFNNLVLKAGVDYMMLIDASSDSGFPTITPTATGGATASMLSPNVLSINAPAGTTSVITLTAASASGKTSLPQSFVVVGVDPTTIPNSTGIPTDFPLGFLPYGKSFIISGAFDPTGVIIPNQPVILDGMCTVNGFTYDDNYQPQNTFHSSISNLATGEELVGGSNTVINQDFVQDIYQLTPTSDNPKLPPFDYNFSVSCPDADDNIQTILSLVGATNSCLPAIPASVTATVSGSSIHVTWPSVAGTSYRVYRDTSTSGTFSLQVAYKTATSATAYYDDKPAAGAYYYKVAAENACGRSALSPASAAASIVTCTKSATPTGLKVTATGQSSINVTWTAVAGSGIIYRVYRDTSIYGTFAAEVYSGMSTSFSNGGLTKNTRYYYKVLSENACGQKSAKTTAVSAITQP